MHYGQRILAINPLGWLVFGVIDSKATPRRIKITRTIRRIKITRTISISPEEPTSLATRWGGEVYEPKAIDDREWTQIAGHESEAHVYEEVLRDANSPQWCPDRVAVYECDPEKMGMVLAMVRTCFDLHHTDLVYRIGEDMIDRRHKVGPAVEVYCVDEQWPPWVTLTADETRAHQAIEVMKCAAFYSLMRVR